MALSTFRAFSSFSRRLVIGWTIILSASALADDSHVRYPMGPIASMTPGELCSHPDSRRYPEQIAYCERSVSPSTKAEIIHQYDVQFGFEIEQMNRQDFKIDHYIPLCMGGSNNRTNLWPQHKTVYEKTDPIEQGLCELMAQGELTQAEAVSMIRDVKNNLDRASGMVDEINRRRHR